MRSYTINFDKAVNRLTPHYMGGRKLILFIQSLVKPLQTLNDSWSRWAYNTCIEASMTSQVILFENYLNKKYMGYFKDSNQRISFSESKIQGVPLYKQAAKRPINEMILFNQSDNAKKNPALNWEYQGTIGGAYDFEVNCPKCDPLKISESDFNSMLNYDIKRYKLACKTYKINYI